MTSIALSFASFTSITKKEEPLPVHRKKKSTITNATNSTPIQSAPALPEQQEFHRHLRDLARGAMRIVLEVVMREELDALLGVGWGESSPKRQGYRNGYYQRDLITTSGRIEELHVPRDREGHFHSQVAPLRHLWPCILLGSRPPSHLVGDLH